MPVEQEILFLDDFVHQNSDIVHWDQIKMNHPIYLEEIRIIPKNCSICLRNGQIRYGVTMPNKFRLDFYSNNLNRAEKERAATLEKIGSLVYDDEANIFDLNSFVLKPTSIPLDWLVITGSYYSLTIALIGVKAKQSSNSNVNDSYQASSLMHLPLSTTTTTSTTINSLTPQPAPPPILPSLSLNSHLYQTERLFDQRNASNLNNQPLLPAPVTFSHLQSHPPPPPSPSHSIQLPQVQHNRPAINYAQQYMLPPQSQQFPNQTSNIRPNKRINTQSAQIQPTQQTNYNSNQIQSSNILTDFDKKEDESKELNKSNDENKKTTSSASIANEPQTEVCEETVESNLIKLYLDLNEKKEEAKLVSNEIDSYQTKNKSLPDVNLDEKCDLFTFDPTELSFDKKRIEKLLKEKRRKTSDQQKSAIESFVNESTSHLKDDLKRILLLKTNSFDLNNDNLNCLDDCLENYLYKSTEMFHHVFDDEDSKINLANLILIVLESSENTVTDYFLRTRQLKTAIKYANLLFRLRCENDTDSRTDFISKVVKQLQFKLVSLFNSTTFNNESLRLKCLNCLVNSLSFDDGFRAFSMQSECQSSLYDLFTSSVNQLKSELTMRLTFGISQIVDMCSFYKCLNSFKQKCSLLFTNSVKDSNAFFTETNHVLKALHDHIKLHLRLTRFNQASQNTFNKMPFPNLFDSIEQLNQANSISNHKILFNILNKHDFFKNVLVLWSYLLSSSLSSLPLMKNELNASIESILGDLFCLNRPNYGHNSLGIEFLYENCQLANVVCKLSKVSKSQILDELVYLLKTVDLFESLLQANFDLFDSVNLLQEIAFFLNCDCQRATNSILVFLTSPNGNMNNKYFKFLLDFFEYLIDDEQHGQDLPSSQTSLRLIALNSLVDVFYKLSRSNCYWSIPNEEFKYLKQFTSSINYLISSLVITKYKPCVDENQSYFVLIEKLKSIKLFVEPLCLSINQSTKECLATLDSDFSPSILSEQQQQQKQIGNSYLRRLNYINALIESFRANIDKNLNIFFSKQFHPTNLKTVGEQKYINSLKINSLNLHITQTRMIYNMIKESETSSMNETFNKKIYLCYLISRNFLRVQINFISKLNDYMCYYSSLNNGELRLNLNQLDLLMALLEPSIQLVKIQIVNLISLRKTDYHDKSFFNVLFRFYGLFNHLIQKSALCSSISDNEATKKMPFLRQLLHSSSNKQLSEHLRRKSVQINENILDIFVSFTQLTENIERDKIKSSVFTSMYRELARYTIEMPFNFLYGLHLLNELLPIPLPILTKAEQNNENTQMKNPNEILREKHLFSEFLSPLFANEKLNCLNLFVDDDKPFAQHQNSTLVSMLRVLSLTSPQSHVNKLFIRVCIQLSDLSDKICEHILCTLLDYAIELFDNVKLDANLIKINDADESDQQNDSTKSATTTALTIANDMEECIYDTNSLIEELSDQPSKPVEEQVKFDLNMDESSQREAFGQEQQQQQQTSEQQALVDYNALFKSTLMVNFSILIKFISSLLSVENKHIDLSRLRLKFIQLILNEPLVKKRDYKQFIFNSLKYCNQIDLNKSNGFLKEEYQIQESLFGLFETLIRHMPNMFMNESVSLDNMLLNDLLLKCLLDHFECKSKSDSLLVTSHVLSCLILLNKFSVPSQFSFAQKLVKIHLNNANPLISRIRELINLFKQQQQQQQQQQLVHRQFDLIVKFFIYLNQLLDELNRSNEISQFKELLKWSNENTNELLIDSISTSNSMISNNQHDLINLDKAIEMYRIPKDDQLLSKKYKYCLNQSKYLIKVLSSSQPSAEMKSTFASNTLSELEMCYSLRINHLQELSKGELKKSYFDCKRNIFKPVDDLKELEKYEIEWKTRSAFDYDNKIDSADINLNLSDIVRFDLNALVMDKVLLKQLSNSSEQHNHSFHQQIQLQQVASQSSEDNDVEMKQNDSLKPKEIINIRSGVKYKAPMRGGHTTSRSAIPSQSSVPGSLSGLIRHDSFRTRTPNTSRPPSLHVDDYYRLENAQKQNEQQSNIPLATNGNSNGNLILINNNTVTDDSFESDSKLNDSNELNTSQTGTQMNYSNQSYSSASNQSSPPPPPSTPQPPSPASTVMMMHHNNINTTSANNMNMMHSNMSLIIPSGQMNQSQPRFNRSIQTLVNRGHMNTSYGIQFNNNLSGMEEMQSGQPIDSKNLMSPPMSNLMNQQQNQNLFIPPLSPTSMNIQQQQQQHSLQAINPNHMFQQMAPQQQYQNMRHPMRGGMTYRGRGRNPNNNNFMRPQYQR